MLDQGILVDGSDCIIMKPSGLLDIRKRMVYTGDIVKLIDPGNRYFNENYSGIGFIVFDTNKAQFIWRGAETAYIGYPEYSMSGKAFEILGNVFENKKILYQHKKTDSGFNGLNMLDVTNKEFLRCFFESNPSVYERYVLIEKRITPGKIKDKEELARKIRLIRSEESRRMLRGMAEARRKERYMKIYEQIKAELNGGEAC